MPRACLYSVTSCRAGSVVRDDHDYAFFQPKIGLTFDDHSVECAEETKIIFAFWRHVKVYAGNCAPEKYIIRA